MIKDPELLKLAVKAIEAEPESWDQEHWAIGVGREDVVPFKAPRAGTDRLVCTVIPLDMEACGTTMCLAGQVVHQAGFPLLSYGGPGERRSISSCLEQDGTRRSIADKAQDLLGLSDRQANDLFGYMTNDLAAFKQRITTVTGVEFE